MVWLCYTGITRRYWKILKLIFDYTLFFNCFHFYVYSVIENCIFHHCKFLCQTYIHKVDLLDLLTILLSTVKILLKPFIGKSKKNIQKHRSKKSQISLFKISHIHKKFCQVETRVKKVSYEHIGD